MEAIWALESHSAAALFPLMDGADFDALCSDIKEHGQQEPIILYNDGGGAKILDGRNRFAACKKIGVKPIMESRAIDDPIAFVVSANLKRRHLAISQRAMIAADVLAAYEIEAKERQRRKPDVVPALAPEQKGESREKAAAQVGVGARSVTSAKTVIKGGCEELQQAVRDGSVPVKLAEKVVRQIPKKETQRAVVLAALADDDPSASLKQHAHDGGAAATNGRRPVGVLRANEAVDCLAKIPKDDPHRERAFQIVTDWIKHNK